ncbi:Receptor Mediated Endocytosis [Pelomyxa schiedti]|nr:Receptor Mediated Endocytosis [Pelomyxa schiedti]
MWRKRKADMPADVYPTVLDGIKRIYADKIRPIEAMYKFEDFHSPLLKDSDFDAKPSVVFLGQYSTGKTSFIRYLLEADYPGQNIGPEPTTDRFVAVMHSRTETIIPGNALVVQADMPFRALSRFGNDFLTKFQASMVNVPILEDLTIIDTPGVLSGEKQRIGRQYDFIAVVEWFASRADMIILTFDAHKLDISDEFKRVIECLKGNDDKVRIVLNKADSVTSQQLMRVYGALMWSLGKVLKTPEVMRVYISSFWDRPYVNTENENLFNAEREDLIRDLHQLPRQSTVRKVNELVKRSRLAKVHAIIIAHLKSEMPSVFGKRSRQEELIANLNHEFNKVMTKYQLSPGDFPEITKFKERLALADFDRFPKLNPKLIESMDEVLAADIPKLVKMFPLEQLPSAQTNPFEFASNFEKNAAILELNDADKAQYISVFHSLALVNGRAPGLEVKKVLFDSHLPKEILSKIWTLCDRGKHGALSEEEFVIAMALVNAAIAGKTLPDTLSSV